MGKTHLIIPDQHAHPDYPNDRADWVGKLIKDIRPDVVVNIGDAADMPSLSSYDKGTRAFQGRNYRNDINAHLDFQERMWAPLKRTKKKKPHSVVLEGNHEYRIKRALNFSPELDGAISFKDFQFERYYDDVVEYSGRSPGVYVVDGVHYAHFFISGIKGLPVSGEHAAYSLLTKKFVSCTQGHSHLLDYCVRTTVGGLKINGLVCGVYQDYEADWAGEANKLWWRGIAICRNVEDGHYDPQFVTLDNLRKEYA